MDDIAVFCPEPWIGVFITSMRKRIAFCVHCDKTLCYNMMDTARQGGICLVRNLAEKVMKSRFQALCLFFAFTSSLASATETNRVERLASVAKLWGTIKFTHPWLAYKPIDWDAALVKSIPRIDAAQSSEEYAAAVDILLAELHDPVTHVIRETQPREQRGGFQEQPTAKMLDGGVLVISLNRIGVGEWNGVLQRMQTAAARIADARAVVIDLRADSQQPDRVQGLINDMVDHTELARRLVTKPLIAAGWRGRMNSGYASAARPVRDYFSGFYIRDGAQLIPGKDSRDIPAIFIMNENSEASQLAIALQGSGRGAIVVEGSASDLGAVHTARLELGEGLSARVRMTELLSQDGSVGITPDVLVPAGADEEALTRALALARDFHPPRSARPRALASSVIQDENSYPDMLFPSREYRLLGAIRVWNVFRYFFAYQGLAGEDWEAVLRQFVPRVENAKSDLDYNLAMAEMVTHAHDSHVSVNSPVIRREFGAVPPLFLRYIGGEAVVAGFYEERAKASGIAIGDVLVKIDGEDARVRIERPHVPLAASTEEVFHRKALLWMLAGPPDSTATLVVRGGDGVDREIKLPRTNRIGSVAPHRERTGEIVMVLPGNIGYADLDRLEAEDVDAMFEQFKGTKGIIFDMRGYPKSAPWSIAARLSRESFVKTAVNAIPLLIGFERPVFQEVAIGESASFYSTIAEDAGKPRYTGLTVMLIDERTASAAEQAGLMFESANGTKFIGSPSAGTNGGVTAVTAPGGMLITFSATDVRHADGRQLQRIGLQPDLSVSPTIAGIRRGQDEILERAIEYVNQHVAR